jgi:hypothetical protein
MPCLFKSYAFQKLFSAHCVVLFTTQNYGLGRQFDIKRLYLDWSSHTATGHARPIGECVCIGLKQFYDTYITVF